MFILIIIKYKNKWISLIKWLPSHLTYFPSYKQKLLAFKHQGRPLSFQLEMMVLLKFLVKIRMTAESLVKIMLKFLTKSFQVMDLKMVTVDVKEMMEKWMSSLAKPLEHQVNAIAMLTQVSVSDTMGLYVEKIKSNFIF